MRKPALVGLLVIAVMLLAAGPSQAWHHWRGGVFVGVGPGYWWGYPYWYPPPYYAPPVVVEEPPVYIERELAPPPAPPAEPAYWYYCGSAKAYYPSVDKCPEAWVKVPARAQ
jgi:hypothetical protein